VKAHVSLGNYHTIDVEAETVDELNKALAEVGALAPVLVDGINVVASAGKATAAKANIDRPAGAASAEPGPAKKCKCGSPMNDVRGKTYKSGAKAGQPYPNDWYPTCKTAETGCKPE
jgi:hypothetical protein